MWLFAWLPHRPRQCWLRAAATCAWLLGGCSTQVAQTAEFGGNAELDCTFQGSAALPSGARFGTGLEPHAVVAGAYAAGRGPGLYVVARDVYRVYLNGTLVTEMTGAREARFVPLSLLPGDNAISVVVSAARGTPAALVHVDDLDQSVVTDSTWRVSAQPSDGFLEASADDSGWSTVTDYGPIGSMPGCDSEAAFPADSEARWVGPATDDAQTVVLRKVIRVSAIGFGERATGGGTATPVLVNGWDEFSALASEPETEAVILLPDGLSDLRAPATAQQVCPSVCTNDAARTRYHVIASDETCAEPVVDLPRTGRTLRVGSNKTIVGLGRGAQLRGVSLEFSGASNVIVRNVALYDVNYMMGEAGDALSLEDSSDIWIDHVTTKWISDDFASLRLGTTDVTLSWMRFDGVTEAACRKFHQLAASVTDASVTFHHCFFDNVESHSPRVDDSLSRVHLFNNLFSGNVGYAVNAVCNAQVLLEANTFQRVEVPTVRGTCDDDTGRGLILARNNFYGEDVGEHQSDDGTEPSDVVFTPTYAYEPDVPEDDWLRVLSRAGVGGPWAQSLTLE